MQISQIVSEDLSISELLDAPSALELTTDYGQEWRKDDKLAGTIIHITEEDKPLRTTFKLTK